MKEQFVTYEIALAVKELGFDEECCKFYNNDKSLSDFLEDKDLIYFINSKCNDVFSCSAPLWQQVIDWLRENYNIYIWTQPINSFIDDEEELESVIFLFKHKLTDCPLEFESNEQAILKALELCQKEK